MPIKMRKAYLKKQFLESVYWSIYVNFQVCDQNSIIGITGTHKNMNFELYKNKKNLKSISDWLWLFDTLN